MKILSLNCQRGYQPGLKDFLRDTLTGALYDFILLQEFAREVPSFVRGIGPYSALEIYDEQASAMVQTCIIYRHSYELLEESITAFPIARPDPVAGSKHSTFGVLFARFQLANQSWLLGSLHLHSGIGASARAAQMQQVKEQALSMAREGDRIIFGGDCNFGLPGERARAERLLKPQFACVTKGIGSTLNSRYVENVPRLPNRVANMLSLVGISVPLHTDHLFVDAETFASGKWRARILSDRVSDHSPVELDLDI